MKPIERKRSGTIASFREAAREEALRLGFSLVGFTSAEPLGPDIQRRWRRWLDKDCAGSMSYLRREHPRRTHPQDLLPEAQSVIVVAAGYFNGDHKPAHGVGKVARYAWGKDYHLVLREKLNELGAWIEAGAADYGIEGPVLYRGHTDSAPIDERSLAVRAGLGFIGKNTLLLHPEHGSWSLLGVLLTSVAFASDEPSGGTCGSCRKCLEACPTYAFEGPYELDPRRCISYLTIEQSEPIAPELEPKMSGWAFGCDVCQEVCPLNAKPLALKLSELAAESGAGPHVTEELWSGIESKKAFARRWGHTPLSRPGLDSVKRNLAAALASSKSTRETKET